MKRLLFALAVVASFVVATVFLAAPPAAAATGSPPPPPPAPPSAYVRTTDFTDGCTDWSLQSDWPGSPTWVFTCTNTDFYDFYDPVNYPNAWFQGWDRYFWNADTQKAILWDYGGYDAWMDWYSDCPFYFSGACQT
jgi:hypothetical protein